MATPILATKLYTPPLRPKVISRPRLIERLNEGLHRKLTLISAPAGFGKTTLVSEWLADCKKPAAWLSLDAADNDPIRFLTYLVAALQTLAPPIGAGVLGVLQSPQPPPIESLLTALLNDITIPDPFVLVLDDYHVLDAQPIDQALTLSASNTCHHRCTWSSPPVRTHSCRWPGYVPGNQLTELRVTDLRFTPSEAAAFLNQVMGLNLSAEDIAPWKPAPKAGLLACN